MLENVVGSTVAVWGGSGNVKSLFVNIYIYKDYKSIYIYKQYIRISYIYTQHDGDITCTCPIGQSIKVFLDI